MYITLAGRYIIQEQIGRDVCGTTHLAQDTTLGAQVVIQTLPDKITLDKRLLADLQRNFLTLHTFKHPNIIQIHALEFDREQSIHFLVLEHVDGVNLLDYRLSKPGQKVEVGHAVEICRQIADALDYAHRQLLHRNIRPDTIILTSEGIVKIGNFRLVSESILGELRRSLGWEYGQPEARVLCYMAPEQFSGRPSTSPASDRWALAVVFYELIAGRLPFDSSDSVSLAQSICHKEPGLPIELGWPLRWFGSKRAFQQAFAKDPGERFESATELIDTISSALFDRIGEKIQTNLVTALGVILLAVLSSALAFLVSDMVSDPDPPLPPQAAIVPIKEKLRTPVKMPIYETKTVLLRIESQPVGAAVILDEDSLGTTPVTVGSVIKGKHHVILEKKGYQPLHIEVNLVEDTILNMSLDEK